MRKALGKGVNSLLNVVGLKLTSSHSRKNEIGDNDQRFKQIYDQCRSETMTSLERMFALYKAVEYVQAANVPGDIVECGVWRGGSSMNAAITMALSGNTSRSIYLYDTFCGMSEPTSKDKRVGEEQEALENWRQLDRGDHNEWDYASLSVVKENMAKTGYPQERIHFVQGKVEETIPGTIPEKIAILRLDTDWYESTYHELTHLFPRIQSGGVLIIDDYGHWQGSKEATDQYFREHEINVLLNRIDYTGRLAVKP